MLQKLALTEGGAKDGYHFVYPNVVTNGKLRTRALKGIAPLFDSIGMSNKCESIMDKNVVRGF